jgi:hypothetical protein
MNWIKHPATIFAIFLTVILMLGACKTQKSISPEGFNNDFMGIAGIECSEMLIPDAIDSKVGTINCNDISFTFDYGKYSYPGPLTPKEEFTRAFDAYHHVKFFEDRMIDPKVFKIFLDSVKVVDVRRKKDTDNLMFTCDPCNTTAQLTFLGDTYYYPLTLSEDQLNMKGYTCSFEERGDYIYKYYQVDNKNKDSGLYISPKKNRYKSKNTLSLVVSKTTLPQTEIDSILKKVYLINN